LYGTLRRFHGPRPPPARLLVTGVALNWADYLVIGTYLVAIVAFGSWFARF